MVDFSVADADHGSGFSSSYPAVVTTTDADAMAAVSDFSETTTTTAAIP